MRRVLRSDLVHPTSVGGYQRASRHFLKWGLTIPFFLFRWLFKKESGMNSTLKSCIGALTGLLIFFVISGESAYAQSLRFEVSQRTVLPLKTPLRITLNNPIPRGSPCSLQIVELNGNVIKDVAGMAGNTYIDIPLTTGIGAFGVDANSVVITDGRYIFRLVTKYPSRINDVVFKEVLWEEAFNVSSNINFTNANLLNKSFIPTPEPEDQYRNL